MNYGRVMKDSYRKKKTRELLGIPNAKKNAVEVSQLDTIDTIDTKDSHFGIAKAGIDFTTMSAFLSCLEDIKLDTVAASSIFMKKNKEMWLEEVEIERSRAWQSRSLAKEVKKNSTIKFSLFLPCTVTSLYNFEQVSEETSGIFVFQYCEEPHIQIFSNF